MDGLHAVGPAWYRAWVVGWVAAQKRRGRAKNTLLTWSVYLRDFGAYLERRDVLDPADIDREILYGWHDELRERLRPGSQETALTGVRSLLKWADREELSKRPGQWAWLEPPTVPEGLLRALEPRDLRTILQHYSRPSSDLLFLRDRALFWFLMTSGARISEALQVDRDEGPMVVVLKGGSEHRIVISDRARGWITDYLRARGRDDQPALWIHLSRIGRLRLRDDQANKVWTHLALELGIRRFTSHDLRHTSATEFGDHNVGDEDVRAHFGWRSTGMMRRYRKLRDDRRQEFVNRLDDLLPPVPPPAANRRRRPRRLRVVRGDGGS